MAHDTAIKSIWRQRGQVTGMFWAGKQRDFAAYLATKHREEARIIADHMAKRAEERKEAQENENA